ncbi:MAG: molybdopterin-dependent oxidoreductase [Pseudomonadota bacterium]|nr:molybdopterin-dependent oxidoreductase [Pseudomonadota bacterium]
MTTDQIVYPTTCWECSTKCGSLVTVEDGKAVKIGPNPDHPASLGAFCVKGIRGLPELNNHDKRVLYPMKRIGERGDGKWARITWDEALDEMADRLLETHERHGPLSLAGAVSSAYFSRGAMVALLMRSLGSPNWMMNQDLCGGCRALSDKITGLTCIGAEDVDNTSCALIVGRNPSAADPAQWMALKRARKNGAKVIVIDPARIPAADMADLWLRPRPGTDAAIGLAMAHVMISENLYDREFVDSWCHGFDAYAERAAQFTSAEAARLSGVPADDIVAAARIYADGPSTFISGHGIDSSSAGVQTFRAFHTLVAISGNLDRVGGNRRVKRPKGFRNYIDILHDPAFRLPREIEQQTIGADKYPLWAGPDGWQTACHNPSVIEAMLTGEPYPVRALHVSGVNIAVTYPDTKRMIAALKSLDFLSVATHMMTPTAEYADLVLPKATSLEEEEVSLDPAAPCVSFTRAIQQPRGAARSDFAFTTDLARRLEKRGVDTRRFFPWETKRDFNAFMLGDGGITFDALEKKGYAEFPYELRNFDAVGFKTPTGKIELYSETLDKLGLDPLPNYEPPRAERDNEDDYPLTLLTGAREKTYHHSRYRDQAWARKVSAFPRLQIHPDTAAAQGLETDDWVAVETTGGSGACQLLITVTDDVPPGIVRTGMGWWLPEADGPDRAALTVNINTAISYDGPWDPITGSADTGGLPCRLEKLTANIIMKQEAMA